MHLRRLGGEFNMAGDKGMAKDRLSRRQFVKGALTTAAVGPWALRYGGVAEAGSEEDAIFRATKKVKKTDLNGMIWSLYYRNMKRLEGEFRKRAGYGVGKIQDISVFQIPQRALAEAVSRSGKFDFFHLDSNMIPSLASAGLIEPLDGYMKEAGFKLDMVGKDFVRLSRDGFKLYYPLRCICNINTR